MAPAHYDLGRSPADSFLLVNTIYEWPIYSKRQVGHFFVSLFKWHMYGKHKFLQSAKAKNVRRKKCALILTGCFFKQEMLNGGYIYFKA